MDRIRRDGRWLRRERLLAGAVTFAVVAFVASGCGSGATGPDSAEPLRVASRTEIVDGGARPAVSGSRVAYLDVRTQGLGMHLHHIPSGRDTIVLVPDPGLGFTFHAAMSGDRVAWAALNEDGTTDILVHDLAGRSTRTLTSPGTLDVRPDLAGDWIVWRSVRIDDGQTDLGVANLAEGTTQRFPDDPEVDELPAVVGDHQVTWSRRSSPGAPFSIALGDPETGEW